MCNEMYVEELEALKDGYDEYLELMYYSYECRW